MDNCGLRKGELELKDYNEDYTKMFKSEKENLEKIFKDKYLKIEHIGSTAIRNIKSKPIIDILIICNDLEDFITFTKENVVNDIYTIKNEITGAGDFLIRKEENGKVKAFIHVFQSDNENAMNCILFRDYLNKNSEEAKKYENLKLELYKKYKNDRASYTSGKTEYINSVLQKIKI